MQNTVVKVVTFGVFDLFHFGHLRLFLRIKEQFGENAFLIVCVQNGEKILQYKPDSKIMYSTEDRVKMIKSLRCVDEVKIYDDIDVDIKQVEFDIWVKGPDQMHQGFQNAMKWCKENGKEIYTLPRTEGISSSYLKEITNDFKTKE